MLASLALGLALLQHTAPPADSLTLDAALTRAWARRGQAAIAAARVAQARANVRVAGTIPNPVASYSNTQDPPHQHALIDQSFEWLLRRGPDRGAAIASLGRARSDSAQVAADLAAAVRRAFFGALAARRGLSLASEQAALADSLAALASRRLASGDISAFERDQVALEAARARQLVSRAREAQRVVQADLVRQLAWEGDAEALVPMGALDNELDEPIAAPPVDSLLFIRAAVADSAAASLRAKSALRARIPLPSVNVGADWNDPGVGGRLLRVIGVTIPIPLWQHGGGAAALAGAQADESAHVTREERLRATSELTTARVRLEETAARARTARDSLLPAAARLRERAAQAYRAGETGVLPVLDALRSERDVTSGALDELLSYQEARATWNSLVGIAR